MFEMIRSCSFLFTAGLFITLVSSFSDRSVKRLEPNLETQPGLWSSLPTDTSFLDDTGFSPEVGDNSDLFNSLPADDPVKDFLASSDLEGSSNLASGDSSCGSQDSSSASPTDDAEIAHDLFSLNSLDARGLLDDVDKLNEVIDSPNGRSCDDPNIFNSKPQGAEPRIYEPKTFIPELYDQSEIRYPVDEFGKCPKLYPEYKEALCCTGGTSGIYVLRCAPALVSFFCGYRGNQYCCKHYYSRDLIGENCIRVSWSVDSAREFPLDPPYDGLPPYPQLQDGSPRTPQFPEFGFPAPDPPKN